MSNLDSIATYWERTDFFLSSIEDLVELDVEITIVSHDKLRRVDREASILYDHEDVNQKKQRSATFLQTL
jgi:hypothetical protein